MTAVDVREDLVPLRTAFDLVWRGYDRDQVQHYVHATETDLMLLTADRDAAVARADELARQLEAARTRIDELSARIDRLCRKPIEPDALTERLRRMVELAHGEAEEITTRARAAAEHSWSVANQATERLRGRAERLVADLDRRRAEMEAEHRELMDRARDQVQTMARQADRRRRELDDEAARLRAQVEADFEIAMAARRAESMRALRNQEDAAKARAEGLVREATQQAERLVAEARAQVDALQAQRAQLVRELRSVQELLADAAPLLSPLEGE